MRNIIMVWAGAIIMASLIASTTSAASYAILVGVSDYEDSTGISDLRGPVNDVRLLQSALAERGDFEISVLADGVEGSQRPTRAAILGALEALQSRVNSGDFVYIHMSGHGTQQPDANGDETDGLDEVFLPADTGRAEPGSRKIPNAILDEELGAAVTALRAKGADVWFVLDSCHSGSGLRAAAPDVATRFVDPAALGIDAAPTAYESRDTSPVETSGDDDLPGKYLAFYAAQSSELAREIEIDAEAASGNGWYGLFTSRLAARLSQGSAGSYRQLFQAVLSDMNRDDIPGSARLQTPLWEGNLIDATVMGGSETIGIRQFRVDAGQVSAGLLHGLQPGVVLSLVADATAGPEDSIGLAQIISATAQSAFIALVDESCVPDSNALCSETGPLPQNAQFARVLARPIDLTLRLAVPVELSTSSPLASDHPLTRELIDSVDRVNGGDTARVELVETGADISVGAHDGALWFGPKVATGTTPIGLSWKPGKGRLDPLLERIFAAEKVARMLDSVAGGGSVLFGNPVQIQIKLRDTTMQNRPRSVTNRNELVQECQRSLPSAEVKDLPQLEKLNQCDQLYFAAQGAQQGPARDVNRVYIDSQYCVETAYARVEGVAVAAQLGDPMTVCADCPSGGTIAQKAGHERLFVVVTEAQDNAEALDLRGLLDNCQAASNGATRSVKSSGPASAFLSSLGTLEGMRGSFGAMGISSLWVERFDWQVLPRREALIQEGIAPE